MSLLEVINVQQCFAYILKYTKAPQISIAYSPVMNMENWSKFGSTKNIWYFALESFKNIKSMIEEPDQEEIDCDEMDQDEAKSVNEDAEKEKMNVTWILDASREKGRFKVMKTIYGSRFYRRTLPTEKPQGHTYLEYFSSKKLSEKISLDNPNFPFWNLEF